MLFIFEVRSGDLFGLGWPWSGVVTRAHVAGHLRAFVSVCVVWCGVVWFGVVWCGVVYHKLQTV